MHIHIDFNSQYSNNIFNNQADMLTMDVAGNHTQQAPARRPGTTRPGYLRTRRGARSGRAGFTLIELLVALGVMAVAYSTISMLGRSSAFTNDTYTVLTALEQAQSFAVSRSTYVWVGFYEEDPKAPGTPGTGQLVISVVASTDGTDLSSQCTNGEMPAAGLMQRSRLIKIPHIRTSTTLTTTQIPNLPAPSYQIDPAEPSPSGNFAFSYPLAGTSQYKFQQIIQFDPHGDASVIYGKPVQVLQLGLIRTAGNVAVGKNMSAIQINGITGKATLYRP